MKREPWAELRVKGAAETVWVPVWALPAKPSTKGEKWTAPAGVEALPPPTPKAKVKRTRQVSGEGQKRQLPPEPEPKKPVLASKGETIREAKAPTRAIPPGPFNETLAELCDVVGVTTAEVAELLSEPLEAVEDMFEGGRPPFHPALCGGYRALAERLSVDVIELQRRAREAPKAKKATGRIRRGRGKVHEDQTEMWIYRPESEGR